MVLCVQSQRTALYQGTLVFAQLMAYLPLSTFRRCVAAHDGDFKVKDFSCLDQFLTMAFAQLTYREPLRDIEVNLRAQRTRLYHMGCAAKPFRATPCPMPTPRARGRYTRTLPNT